MWYVCDVLVSDQLELQNLVGLGCMQCCMSVSAVL